MTFPLLPDTPGAFRPDGRRRAAFSTHSVRELGDLGRALGVAIDCALVYSDAAPDWPRWCRPWFLDHPDPDRQWARWRRARPGRRLVIAPGLVPSSAPADWRSRGAEGRFDHHVGALGAALVDAGLGDSVIRLGHEANGDWFPHRVGDGPTDAANWIAYWRRTAQLLRATPGAAFVLDWTVSSGWPGPECADWYPGDDVVDVVGLDVFDLDATAGGAAPGDPRRWEHRLGGPTGPAAVLAFAAAHGKPVSVPEWGLVDDGGGGDDPAFVSGLDAVLAPVPLVYHGIFADTTSAVLRDPAAAPRAAAAYRRCFGC